MSDEIRPSRSGERVRELRKLLSTTRTAIGRGVAELNVWIFTGRTRPAKSPLMGNMKASTMFAFVAASMQAIGPAQGHAKPVVIPLTPYLDSAWTLEAEIGSRTGRFLFDTGGGITVITPNTAVEAGCVPWGRMTGFRMRGDRVDMTRCDNVRFRVKGRALHKSTVGVLDFATLLPPGAPELAGSVALDSFGDRIVTIDLSRRRVILNARSNLAAQVAGAKEVRLRLAREVAGRALVPLVAVRTARGPVWMQLDTGSDASVVVGEHNADAFGLQAGTNRRQQLHAELEGDVPLSEETVRVAPLVIDGNIGSLTLKRWVVTLDLPNRRAWIAPSNIESGSDIARGRTSAGTHEPRRRRPAKAGVAEAWVR